MQQDKKGLSLGANCDSDGCFFSILTSTELPVTLILFDKDNQQYAYSLNKIANQQLGTYIKGVKTGIKYSYQINNNEECQWLLDPYAKQISTHPCTLDVPIAVVTHHQADWQQAIKPQYAMVDTIIYELHVKGFTKLNTLLPENVRGKFLGLCHPNVISHFKQMGITSLQLMPIMASVDELHLQQKKLTNYWGYNPICWFAPDPKFGIINPVEECKTMINTLHQHGIEVILDVVFNHTSEAGEDGAIHHFKALLPEVYLSQKKNNKVHYLNYTGCGNTLDAKNQHALQIIMDALRFWVQEYQVDGFRFDLAATLGRNRNQFNKESAFFHIIAQDPVLKNCKLIAEPWDIGPDGYQLGNFPINWHECSDKYRDTVRNFWNHDASIGDLARQIMGSRDIFSAKHWPYKFGVNYISYHDGFTLEDLVSYSSKHNEQNSENNRDGHNHNCSFNYGIEGKTCDTNIIAVREKQKRNLITTLLFSFGIPHLLAVDTFNHTQNGNNNAYCQDNEISWNQWPTQSKDFEIWLKKMIHLRQQYMSSIINAFTGKERYLHTIEWLEANGNPIQYGNWQKQHPLQLYIAINKSTPALLYLINRTKKTVMFTLPSDKCWERICDTNENQITSLTVNKTYSVKACSMVILKQ